MVTEGATSVVTENNVVVSRGSVSVYVVLTYLRGHVLIEPCLDDEW